jgi:hypothetical protein
VALHAGGLPGYAESHGCVHLPSEFARLLFEITATGMTVVVASDATQPEEVVRPGFLAPVSAAAAQRLLDASETMRWEPQLSTEGPVSAVLSRVSGRIIVFRNGVEIGRARVVFHGSEPLGTQALVLVAKPAIANVPAGVVVREPERGQWVRIGIAGRMDDAGTAPDADTVARIEIPPEFRRVVYEVMSPGSTLLVTDAAVTSATTGPEMQVVDANPPE